MARDTRNQSVVFDGECDETVGPQILDRFDPRCEFDMCRCRRLFTNDDLDMFGADTAQGHSRVFGMLQAIHRRSTDKAGDKKTVWFVVEVIRRAGLFDQAITHQNYLVSHCHGLDLIMGDIDHGHTEPLLQSPDFQSHLVAQLGVEIGKRLVHQAHRMLGNHRTGQSDTLALPAR